MLRICDHPDCSTMTLGAFCVTHDPPVTAEPYPRGRPYPRLKKNRGLLAVAPALEPDPAQAPPVRAVSFGGGIER
jgi:hypothetical protein